MGKNNLQLPQEPAYKENSNLSPNIDLGSQTANDLISGNFGGRLSWLSPTINNNNSANALSYAQATLQPQFRDTLQQISNQAAANGQLNSSTFSDALARSQSDLNSQYQGIVSQQAINDSNQSNANRLNLFGTGLDTLQNFTGLAQGQTNAQNQFNLDNYDNQVAAVLAGQKQSGGLSGGIMGALGGAGLGVALAPFTGGLSLGLTAALAGAGGFAGATSSQSSNAGGSLLGSGASLLGNSMNPLQSLNRFGLSSPGAGFNASNNPFADITMKQGYLNN